MSFLLTMYIASPLVSPWLTLAIDVCTRMITGYYISFDAPSQTSVAMCVAHSILPKEEWMMLHDVEADWPVWGKPTTIHVDNGPDFRSENFRHSCAGYGINLEFRPVKRPHYGAHIERLMGTVMGEVHNLPGTTFSSIVERMEYDSDKNAVLTMSEFEQWLVTYITKVYHQRLHTGIGLSPIKMWERGIFGICNGIRHWFTSETCGQAYHAAGLYAFIPTHCSDFRRNA
ncbi:hypothetical protein [Erwinia sp. V71]|uniref:hypothetical protein n=1 Tax=Erwinia sp. V71 TaxID=3369424 RepID=UPI003F60554C